MKAASRKNIWLGSLLLLSGAALAAAIVLRASDDDYGELSNVRGTTVVSDAEIRTAGLSQAAARYRQLSGLSALPVGSEFTMVWGDGSSERASITRRLSSLGAVPIPGSQRTSVRGCGVIVECLPR